VIIRASGEYEIARNVYNAMIDRRPAAIVRCVDVEDVTAALNFTRQDGLTVAIRGGGHNGAGLAVCDQGREIALSPMKGVRVDPTNGSV
jgi:FAD/FMN-containing dehydrogenase